MLLAILEESLLFFPFILGIYLHFHVMKRPDLSVDGLFVLGGGMYAKLAHSGVPLGFSLALTLCSAAIVGVGSALMQRRGRIPALMAGIFALFILQSLNLILMGKPNLSLLEFTPLTEISGLPRILVLLIGCAAIFCMLLLFLRTKTGLKLRAFGSNSTLLMMQGHPAERYRILGLVIGSILVAFSGCFTAQANAFADINMGTGQVLIGLGIVLLAHQGVKIFFQDRVVSLGMQILACFLSTFAYYALLHFLMVIGVPILFIKLCIAIIFIAILLLNSRKELREVFS